LKTRIEQEDDSIIEISDDDDEELENEVEFSGYQDENAEDIYELEIESQNFSSSSSSISQNNSSSKSYCINRTQENTSLTGKNENFPLSKQPLMTPIDTVKLVKTVKNILKEAKIPQYLFARKVLGIHLDSFRYLLHYSLPWVMCKDNKKILYKKMNEWVQSPEESIETFKQEKHKRNVNNIDTIELASTIKARLIQENLPRCVFGKEVLGIQSGRIANLLNHPKPWSNCSENGKELYIKMFEWIKAPQESIKSIQVLNSETAYEFEGEVELDAYDLAERVNNLLASQIITKLKFTMIIDAPDSVFDNLRQHPMPWHLLSKARKDHYSKIQAWLLQNKVESVPGKIFNRPTANKDRYVAVNTAEVASEIVQLLKINGISHGYFAARKLKILTAFFEQLVNNPKPYADLKESERKIFQCMKKWTGPDEMKVLKRSYVGFSLSK
jgi:hypothetical protein